MCECTIRALIAFAVLMHKLCRYPKVMIHCLRPQGLYQRPNRVNGRMILEYASVSFTFWQKISIGPICGLVCGRYPNSTLGVVILLLKDLHGWHGTLMYRSRKEQARVI